ncbi:MAG: AAA family ATPase [Bacteroidales bacterium]|nr:AAA family ATPase [Bacteroidales bacterium]
MSEINTQAELARNFIENTNVNIFLTGKAGTGKTTFLRSLKASSPKRMIILAPTGVAAINAGGVTIHSFFQLPFAPFIPQSTFTKDETVKNFANKFSREKINIIKSLDLLVIDEISMVRSDLLDAVDTILRKYKNRYKPFGGIQLLMIGDLQQLAPVIREDEWSLLKGYYASPYFFHSHSLNETNFITIELQKVFRQSDPGFVSILNSVRENQITQSVIDALNQRYKPGFNPNDEEKYITLTTHNYQADSINKTKIDEIDEPEFTFKAKIEGDFPEYSYPTNEKLTLKKGAQVMFVKNDPTPEKRFYNGKIGRITAIGKGGIVVKCDDITINVETQVWTNAKYTIDPESKEITEKIEGSFTQYPLKTAWAITIHKSQGLTFDKAIIDAGKAFTHGQVYVALSRCRTLNGLVLRTPISSSAIMSDRIIDNFNQEHINNFSPVDILDRAKKDYFVELVFEQFDFRSIMTRLQYLIRILDENLSKLYPSLVEDYKKMSVVADEKIYQVGIRFRNQLTMIISELDSYENNDIINDRTSKGAAYFIDNIKEILLEKIESTSFNIDNKEIKNNINKEISALLFEINLKIETLNECTDGFSTKKYLSAKSKASIEKDKPKKETSPKIKKEVISSDINNPELYSRLNKWRKAEADEKNLPVYTIIQQKAMIGLSNKMPSSKKELLSIPGIGKKIVEYYGEKIIEIIDEYRIDKAL